jgi:hypothetical protein
MLRVLRPTVGNFPENFETHLFVKSSKRISSLREIILFSDAGFLAKGPLD